MGASGTKTHEAFTVTPAPAPPTTIDPDHSDDSHTGDPPTVFDTIYGAPSYHDLVAATHAALADAATLSPQLQQAVTGDVHDAVKAWMAAHHDELSDLAGAHGLAHADMVSKQAASHWLDPSYPPDAPSKAAIAAKAQQRYDTATADGATVESAPAPIGPGQWAAIPAEVIDAQTAFTAALTAAQAQHPATADTAALSALLTAEQHLAAAHCPEIAGQVAAATAAAKHAVDTQLGTNQLAARVLVGHQAKSGAFEADTARSLDAYSALQLQRVTTADTDRAALLAVRAERLQQLATFHTARQQLHDLGANNGTLTLTDPATIGTFAAAANDHLTARADAATWHHQVVTRPQLATMTADQLAVTFRAAAKTTPIGDLRTGAAAMGLDDAAASTASRAQLQNWVIAHWHPGYDQTQLATAMTKPAPSPPTPPPAASTSTPKAASTGGVTAGSGAWHAKHAQLVANLKHHAATLTDLPARPDPSAVASWTFTAGPKLSLGGMHTKSVHTAPDGSAWLFKPDKHGGARATAEVTANRMLTRVGIPTVAVYARPLNGNPGTVQPLLTGASTLGSNPATWSQSDVDAIVRYHAAAWVIGDHDAKHDNLLRTPSGGLVPIDQGQAFKFYGRDQLSTSYHPNSSYGAAPPVWNTLYAAHKSGALAPGVTVRPAAAVAVIKAFEAMPDAEFAAILAPTAQSGATNPAIHWRDTMTARAAAAGHTNPSAVDVADAFVNHGLERKHGLRASFAALFASAGIAGADVLTKTR